MNKTLKKITVIICSLVILSSSTVAYGNTADSKTVANSQTNANVTATTEATLPKSVKYDGVTYKLNKNNKYIATSKEKMTNVKGIECAKYSIKVTVKKTKAVKGYQVKVATNDEFTKNVKSVTTENAKNTTVTVDGLKTAKVYYIKVRTYSLNNVTLSDGTEKTVKLYSKWSTITTAITSNAKLGIAYSQITDYENSEAIVSALNELGYKNAKGSVYILSVDKRSNLSTKDIREYDIIVAVNDKTMTSTDVLTSAVAKSKPGDTITLTIARIENNFIRTFDVKCKLISSK